MTYKIEWQTHTPETLANRSVAYASLDPEDYGTPKLPVRYVDLVSKEREALLIGARIEGPATPEELESVVTLARIRYAVD